MKGGWREGGEREGGGSEGDGEEREKMREGRLEMEGGRRM